MIGHFFLQTLKNQTVFLLAKQHIGFFTDGNEVVGLGLYGDKVKVMAAIRIFLHIVPRQGHDVTATEACQTRENGSPSQNVVLAWGLI